MFVSAVYREPMVVRAIMANRMMNLQLLTWSDISFSTNTQNGLVTFVLNVAVLFPNSLSSSLVTGLPVGN